MSSEKDLVSKKGRFNLQRASRRPSKVILSHLWRQETPQRSASRSKLAGEKKIKKTERGRMRMDHSRWKNRELIFRPSPPHNTTQYIIYANDNCPEEAQNIYTEHDKFKYDFEHHAMAGSMMDLMRERLAEEENSNQSEIMSSEMQTPIQTGSFQTPSPRVQNRFNEVMMKGSGHRNLGVGGEEKPVNSVYNNGLDTDFFLNITDRGEKESDPYSHYLKQADSGTDLQNLVKQLVSVLDQKDQQISFLKSKIKLNAVADMEKR